MALPFLAISQFFCFAGSISPPKHVGRYSIWCARIPGNDIEGYGMLVLKRGSARERDHDSSDREIL